MVYAERYSTKKNMMSMMGWNDYREKVHSRVRDLGKLQPRTDLRAWCVGQGSRKDSPPRSCDLSVSYGI